MISRSLYAFTILAIVGLASSPVGAGDLATYRDFTLGASTVDVIAHAGAAPRDLKVLHDRPAVLEELSWRPPYRTNGDGRDSVAAIVFSFIDHQLYRMVVDYDRSRTEGLTAQDMMAAVSTVYGPRSTAPVPPVAKIAYDSIDTPTMVAWWRQADTLIVLNQSAYSGRFGLVISSVAREAAARSAQAAAVAMDVRDAPAREAARLKADDAAQRAAAEKTRTANKDAFKP